MLTGLSIRDVVLIDKLDLSFSPGLCALTGETGAGKSILLDALGLAIGDRADSALVRRGAERASVTAAFDVQPDHPARRILAEQDLDEGGSLLLRRTVAADGGSRAFVNDRPATVATLKALGSALIEIQGQAEQRGLVDPAIHRGLLDAFGDLGRQVDATADAWQRWRDAAAAEAEAAADYEAARVDEDFLRHAVGELDALAPRDGEEAVLAERRGVLMNAEKLVAGLNDAVAALSGDADVETSLRNALATIDRIAPVAAGALDAGRSALERAIAETAEAVTALSAAGHAIEVDQGSLEEVEERLFRLREVARKHGTEIDALPALRDELARRLAVLEDQSDARGRLAKATAAARKAYETTAHALRDARIAAARRLDAAIAHELPPLRLDKAIFATEIAEAAEADWGRHGIDRVRFLVATVPGNAPGPLAKVASGGELSRLMLALRVVLTGAGSAPTLVFDEVDSGIGGATAAAVGERLARLSERFQVLVVTHSPQVAARADHHLRVDKTGGGDGLRTEVSALDAGDRQEEIARMLSGRRITAEARAAAASLLQGDAA
jgi:DNA repair protein RecN (Recombination protein N)